MSKGADYARRVQALFPGLGPAAACELGVYLLETGAGRQALAEAERPSWIALYPETHRLYSLVRSVMRLGPSSNWLPVYRELVGE